MKRKAVRTILRAGGWLLLSVALLGLVAVLLFFFNKPLVKNIAQKYLSSKTGLSVRIGTLDYDLSPLSVRMRSLDISQDAPLQSLEVKASSAEAKGDLWRLIKGKKPFFETVKIEGAEISYKLKEFPEVEVDYGQIIGSAADALSSVKEISLGAANASLDLPGQILVLENAALGLSGSGRPAGYALNLSSGKVRFELKSGNVTVEGRLESAGSLMLARNPRLNGRFSFGSLSFAGEGGIQTFESVTLDADAEWKTASDTISLSAWRADAPGLVKASGSAEIGYGEGSPLSAGVEARFEDAGAVLRRLDALLPRNMKDLQAEGAMNFKGTFHRTGGLPDRKENLDAVLETERLRLRFAVVGAPFRAEVSGSLTADGPLSDIRVAGRVTSTVHPPAGKDLKLRSVDLALKLRAGRDLIEVPDFSAVLKGFSFAAGGNEMSFEEVKAGGGASLDLRRKLIALERVEVRAPGLPPLEGSSRICLAAGGETQVSLKGEGFRISEVRRVFSSLLPSPADGWEFDAVWDMEAVVRTSRAKPDEPGFSAVLRFEEGKFNDPSFSVAGEGLRPELRIEGRYSIPRKNLAFSGEMRLEAGESLWKDFYISWQKFPMSAGFSGVFDHAAGKVGPLSVRCSSPQLGEISADGACSLRAPLSMILGARARLRLGTLQPLFSQAGAALDSRVSLEGSLDGEARISGSTEGFSVKGRLRLERASAENPGGGLSLRDIAADIPVFFRTGAEVPANGGDPSDRGFFRAGAFRAGPFLTPQPLSLELRSGANSFRFEPFSLDLFGGRLDFGQASFAFDPVARTFSGRSSVSLAGLDFSRIPLNSSQFRLSGEARGDFARIEITPEKISARGQGEADIFGGKVIVRDISIIDPFRKGRAIVLDIDLVDLDLKKVTDSVPFGEVTGIIRGEVRGLSITYGQPERFDLKLESVKREGVPQTFSLKAIDNITVISSGEPASLGTSQFWMRFIRGFRYDKIGIVSTLRNDTFTLNGTVKEDGIEYLVKKPGPFGINVINRMPEKQISFKEMTARLKRVGQSEKKQSDK